MPGPTLISAGTIPLPIKISVPRSRDVLVFFDRIRVYRSATIDGPYLEITAPGTRIPIVAGQSTYLFYDSGGTPTDYYVVDYFNSTTGAASPQSSPQQALGDTVLDVLSVDELKENYLFGLPLEDDNGNQMPDSFFEFYIRSAVAYAERRLNTRLSQTIITDERHDFVRQDYNKYIWLQLKNKPLISVQQVRLVLPTNQQVISYPIEWTQPDYDAATIQIVPGSGSTAAVALGLSALWAPIINGLTDFLPDVFRVDYTCGFVTVPHDIKDLIGKLSSLGPLAVIGDLLFGPGVAGQSMSLDALMTNTRTTKDGQSSAFGARLRQYRTEINEMMREIRRDLQGIRMVTA